MPNVLPPDVLLNDYEQLKHLAVEAPEIYKRLTIIHPNAIEFELLVKHLKNLQRGKTINHPIYSYLTCLRSDKTIEIKPKKVIIVEGILIFTNKELRDLFDIKVFAIVEDTGLSSKKNYASILTNNILDEIASILIIIGAILIAFSKEKLEDEFISKIRLESLAWAVYINYTILILAIVFSYGFSFFWALIFNMFTLLIFFLVRFNWILYTSKNQITDEE